MLRSLAPGQNPICYLSGQTISSYKGFIWQALWGKTAFPTLHVLHSQCLTTSEANCSQRLVHLAPNTGHAPMHICIPSPCASMGPPYQGSYLHHLVLFNSKPFLFSLSSAHGSMKQQEPFV